MSNGKYKLYEQLLEKQKSAHDQKYFYESCWFAHAIFEDRTSSILKNSSDGSMSGGKLAQKLKEISRRMDAKKRQLVRGKRVRDKRTGNSVKVPQFPILTTIDPELINAIDVWRRSRNDLAHKLATGESSLKKSDKNAQKLSKEALSLVREIAAAARRIKKQRR